MRTRPLVDGWTLRLPDAPEVPASLRGSTVDAVVPGSVHEDLLRAGLIRDPLHGTQELDSLWVGHRDWIYEVTAAAADPGAERTDLVFDGLDTLAEIALDGTVVATTRNMHRRYRFDVTDALRSGPARLQVRFASAQDRSDELAAEDAPPLPNATGTTFQYVRKMACSYGWDWGPVLATAGIWRDARVESWSTARIAETRPQATLLHGDGVLDLHVGLERTVSGAGRPLRLTATVLRAGAVVAEHAYDVAGDAVDERIVVGSPDVWWPHAYGEQPLYDVRIALLDVQRGEELDRADARIGFRSVRIDEHEDETGRAFRVVVNDVPIFARGVNWIPDDLLLARVTDAQHRERLLQARDANVDLVRVWGGGVFERSEFYATCDELGLLVWQDFLFACAAYPEEEPLWSEVEAEARDNVSRLAPHPSIVVWNGNNENFMGHENWGWKPVIGDRTWGRRYYLDLLPTVVRELDPWRPYTPASPWSGSEERHPNDERYGTVHAWTKDDYLRYRDTAPRYVSEFGNQGPAAWSTLRGALDAEPSGPDDRELLHHQRMVNGNTLLLESIERHFGAPVDMGGWHLLASLNQCRANRAAIDHWRARWPDCAGAVVWQLNDCWPAISWSMIDSAGVPKPMYFALRDAFAPRVMTIQPDRGVPGLVLVNQTGEPWSTVVRLERRTLEGDALDEAVVEASVAPHSTARLPIPARITSWTSPRHEFAAALADDGARALWFGVEDLELELAPDALRVDVEVAGDSVAVRLAASSLVKDVLVQADRLVPGAVATEGFLTLLPGERAEVRFRVPSGASARAEALAATPWGVSSLNEVLGAIRAASSAPTDGAAADVPSADAPEPAARTLN